MAKYNKADIRPIITKKRLTSVEKLIIVTILLQLVNISINLGIFKL